MQSATRTLVSILFGLIIAVIVGLSAGTARAATLNYTAVIDTLQGGTGGPFAIGQTITGSITIDSLNTDLAGALTLTAYSGITSMTANDAAAGFNGSGTPGNPVNHPNYPSPSWEVDGLVLTNNTASNDTMTINIGLRDTNPDNWGGLVSGTPDPATNGKTFTGISLEVRDADGTAFDGLGNNPDPVAALNYVLTHLGEFNDNPLDRAEIRLHFDPDAGANQPSKITAQLVPVPAAVWLFGSAFGMLAWFRRKVS